jgi:hypothetical protein
MFGFRAFVAPAVLLALVGVGLDVVQWSRAAPLWVDEQMIALNVRDRALLDLAGPLWLGQTAPLGWLVLQRTAILLAGTSELVLRFVPLLFGALTLAVAAWIAVGWLRAAAGLLLVAMIAIGSWMSHYRFELKHYSADAFGALLLPAMAAWVAEARDPVLMRWRWTRWWAAAALLQWVANGATFVVPGCAGILAVAVWLRHGVRAAAVFAATGVLWGLSFAAHYALSLQYGDQSPHLRSYWANYVAPWGSVTETVGWIAARFEPLASHPGGASVAAVFWVAAIAGLALTRQRWLGLMFLSVPLSGFALALAGFVPLHDRVALWITPALYAGIALLADEGIRRVAASWRPRLRRAAVAAGAVAVSLTAWSAADILASGWRLLDLDHATGNHALDDRAAVRWLMDRREPGDALISTRLGWPAIWWYGGIDIGRPIPRARLADGAVMYETSYDRAGPHCERRMLQTLATHRRALVHVGFPDMPDGFYEDLLSRLSPYGTVVEEATFADRSRTAVIVFGDGPSGGPPQPQAGPDCLVLSFARRW